MKSMILYYSRSGNTKTIAEKLKEAFGSEIVQIEPEKAYGNYLSAVLRNGREKLSRKAASVATPYSAYAKYDVIFVGFPVWYGTMPDFMQAYLRKCAVRGKTVIPFATAGANGKDSSLETVKKLFSRCTVSDYFYTTKPKSADVDAWIRGLTEKLQ